MIHSDDTKMPALFAALAKAQAKFGQIEKSTTVTIRPRDASKPAYSFKYAPLSEILAKTRTPLNEHGLALIQPVMPDETGTSWLVTALTHDDGAALVSKVKAPDPTEDPKVYGGLLSFMRRYMASAMLCLAADDDLDDNGEEPPWDEPRHAPAQRTTPARKSATPSEPAAAGVVTAGQLANLNRKISAAGLDQDAIDAMCARLGVPNVGAGMSVADWTKVKHEVEKAV